MRILAIDDVSLSVEEPAGDLVLGRVLDDGDNSFEFFGCDFTGTILQSTLSQLFSKMYIPLIQIDIGFLADQVGISAAYTLDTGQGVHDLLLSIDVGVKETQDELEVRLFAADESCVRMSVIRSPS